MPVLACCCTCHISDRVLPTLYTSVPTCIGSRTYDERKQQKQTRRESEKQRTTSNSNNTQRKITQQRHNSTTRGNEHTSTRGARRGERGKGEHTTQIQEDRPASHHQARLGSMMQKKPTTGQGQGQHRRRRGESSHDQTERGGEHHMCVSSILQ